MDHSALQETGYMSLCREMLTELHYGYRALVAETPVIDRLIAARIWCRSARSIHFPSIFAEPAGLLPEVLRLVGCENIGCDNWGVIGVYRK